MKVGRIHTESGSHIEPPFDPTWDELTKLQWQAAVTSVDCGGLRIKVHPNAFREKINGEWRDVPGYYSLQLDHSSVGSLGYRTTWSYLNGISIGWREARRSEEDPLPPPSNTP